MRRRTVAAWLCLSLCVSACQDAPERRQPVEEWVLFKDAPPSNLLVISIDTLRKDHVGFYGDRGLTPFLDSLAAEAVIVDDYTQCSNWTTASVACAMSGSGNLDRGISTWIGEPVPLERTLASDLGDAGFYSVFGSPNGYFSSAREVITGVDEEFFPPNDIRKVARQGAELLRDARARGDATGPSYLHLHAFEPHGVYAPEPEFLAPTDLEPWPDDLSDLEVAREVNANLEAGVYDRAQLALLEAHMVRLYEGEVRMLDDRLRQVWLNYDRLGLLDDTLVVVWTDHGEQFWEHGALAHAHHLNAEETDGALFFWAKGMKPGHVRTPVHATDLVPTLLDLYGLPIPEGVTGIPIPDSRRGRVRFQAVDGKAGRYQAVMQDGYKLIYDWSSGDLTLYDRQADPTERTRLPSSDPRVEELWCALQPQAEIMDGLLPSVNRARPSQNCRPYGTQ